MQDAACAAKANAAAALRNTFSAAVKAGPCPDTGLCPPCMRRIAEVVQCDVKRVLCNADRPQDPQEAHSCAH